MTQLSILIVEDDFLFALELEILVKEIGYQVLASVDNSAEALELIYATPPDLILMDINIKGKLSGIEVAEKTQHLDIPVLFITSLKQEQHYARAKQTNFVGYMVKPLEVYSLQSSIELAVRSLNLKGQSSQETPAFPFKDTLFFKKKGVFQKVNISSIDYIEADGNYSITWIDTEKLITSISLAELEKLLQAYHFMRIHRRFLINLQKVQSIDTANNKILVDDQDIPISRAQKPILLKKIKLLQ